MSDDQIQVEVTRTGGFAGTSRTGRVDVAELDEETATTLRLLVSELEESERSPGASATGGRGADRYQYNVTIVRGENRYSLVLHESDMSDADQRLVRLVLAESRDAG